jgi:rare lipoprotein A
MSGSAANEISPSTTKYCFSLKDMNQPRWNCLTTIILAAIMSPIAGVQAKTLTAPVVGSEDNYVPISPQSLPTITPLTVTELETEEAIPTVNKAVPAVAKLPAIALRAGKSKVATLPKQRKITSAGNARSKKLQPQNPVAKLPAITPLFNPTTRATEPIVVTVTPIDSVVVPVNSVLPLPQLTTSASTPQTSTAIATASDRPELIPVPQVTPINAARAEQLRHRADVPSFEAGLPVFIFDSERPNQIVATAIAQVGNTIVAPEQSIAIPVERPKKSTTQTQLPVTVPTVEQPQGTGIVKIEPPATIQPTLDKLDKIVATQTGTASWYGSEGGPKTANGERYNPNGLTAAHRTLPFGTKVRVTSLKTGKTVTVRINDRGPFHRSRMIDVSAGAAKAIGLKSDGVGTVRIEILGSQG